MYKNCEDDKHVKENIKYQFKGKYVDVYVECNKVKENKVNTYRSSVLEIPRKF